MSRVSSEALAESLLRAEPLAPERRPASRWAYPLGAMLLVSAFVLYHTAVLLVWNLPGKSIAKQFHSGFLEKTRGLDYFKGTRLTQSWSMFAPNPNRTNNFVQVYVRDQNGEDWDFEQDIWAENRYPYVFYDRRGKINRRIDGKKQFQRIYGAWVCREWERIHGGESARSVTFIRRLTRVPTAAQVIQNGGWDQWSAESKQTEQETVTCKTVPHGTLPNQLRERYGLPLIDEDKQFVPVNNRTWWDQREAERRRAEREAQQAATRERFAERKRDADEPHGEEDSPDH
jgi:hypothetical protein